MPIFRFLALVLRPISKLESVVGWKDVVNLLILAGYIAIPNIPQWREIIPNQLLIWFVGIPALLFLIAGIKLQFRLSALENKRPSIRIKPMVYNNQAFLEVYNSGASAIFQATGRVTAHTPSSQPYVMYWEGMGANRTIDKNGQGEIKVAEKSKYTDIQGRDADTAIYEHGLIGFKMGTTGEQPFPIRTSVQHNEGDKVVFTLEDKGEVEITITSNPALVRSVSDTYLLEFDDRRDLVFIEKSIPDRVDSRT